MPYIKQIARLELKTERPAETAGELNYIFTQICINYLKKKGNNYQNVNDIIGALDSCKLEFYRRQVAPYEDLKIEENGDVYFK